MRLEARTMLSRPSQLLRGGGNFRRGVRGLDLGGLFFHHRDQVIDDALVLPPWVGQEVTSDPRYLNSSLASSE